MLYASANYVGYHEFASFYLPLQTTVPQAVFNFVIIFYILDLFYHVMVAV